MISCNNLTVKYGKHTVLDKISLNAENGEITVLLGKNGSGKTTLIRTLAGVQSKFDGEIFIDSKSIRQTDRKRLSRAVGILPQNLQKPAITVTDLVSMGRYPYTDAFSKLSAEDISAVERSIKTTGIEHLQDKLVCHLSGGERQLAYISTVIAQNTNNILLDEPTASLDISYRKQFFEILNRLKNENKCVVLSMHSLAEAVKTADKIVFLDNKKIVFCGNTKQFISQRIRDKYFNVKTVELTNADGISYYIFE